jgi:hypothetical protein
MTTPAMTAPSPTVRGRRRRRKHAQHAGNYSESYFPSHT